LPWPLWLPVNLLQPSFISLCEPSLYLFVSSAMRLQEIVLGTLLTSAWIEVKWHLHHSHLNMSYGAYFMKGMPYDEIDELAADNCDEGLFVDKDGKPVSPLEDLGHKPGMRKKWLESQKKKDK